MRQVEFTFDKSVMMELLSECRDLLLKLVEKHLTPKSLDRIRHVFNHYSDPELLTHLYDPQGTLCPNLSKICSGLNRMIEEGKLWTHRERRAGLKDWTSELLYLFSQRYWAQGSTDAPERIPRVWLGDSHSTRTRAAHISCFKIRRFKGTVHPKISILSSSPHPLCYWTTDFSANRERCQNVIARFSQRYERSCNVIWSNIILKTKTLFIHYSWNVFPETFGWTFLSNIRTLKTNVPITFAKS